MSTIDSYGFLAAVTFGRDIVWRLKGSRGDSTRYSRYGLVVTGFASAGLAIWRESIVGLWHDLGSVGTPVLLLPLALSFGQRHIAAPWIFAAMIGGGGIAALWIWFHQIGAGYPWGIEPIFPGLLISGIFCLVGWLRASRY
jgi:Na+/pantothenate symporter